MMGDLGAPPTPFGDHPAVEGTRPPQPTLPDEINPTRSFEVPATSRSLLLSLCPQTLPSSPPKPSWALSLLKGAAAAVVQPHLCLIFQAKPHSPVGRRSMGAPWEQRTQPDARLRMWSLGQEESGAGGARTEHHWFGAEAGESSPPSLLGGAQPRTGSTWPWRGDDAELEARPAVSRGAP